MLISCWTHVNEMWEQRGHEVSTDGEILRLMLATNPQSNSILTRVHWSSWLVFHVPQSSSLLLWLCIHAQLWCIGVLSLKTHHNPGYKHGTLSGDINTVSVVFFKRCHCWSRWWAVLLIKVIDNPYLSLFPPFSALGPTTHSFKAAPWRKAGICGWEILRFTRLPMVQCVLLNTSTLL